jgi:sec-independent protein translocase protein TatA
MPFNLGGPELIIVLVIVLIVFGAGKLPKVMRDLGTGVKEFKKAQTDEEREAAAMASASSAAPAAPETTAAPAASNNGTATVASRGTETSSRA